MNKGVGLFASTVRREKKSDFHLLEGVIVWLKQEQPDFRIAFFQ